MARHRNVRNMNYDDECDFDDTYGRSVEDDYCISPSTAAEFMYDRSTSRHSMSAFLASKDHSSKDTESEEELSPPVRQEKQVQYSPLDEARLQSCLEGIRNVVGDNIPEQILIDAVVKHNFDMERALDAVLSNQISPEKPKPQRQKREGRRSDDSSDSEREGVDEIAARLIVSPSEFSLNLNSLSNNSVPTRTHYKSKSFPPELKSLVPHELQPNSGKVQQQNLKEDSENFCFNINLSSFISVSPKGNLGIMNSDKKGRLHCISNHKQHLKTKSELSVPQDKSEPFFNLKNSYDIKQITSSVNDNKQTRLDFDYNIQSDQSNELPSPISNKHCTQFTSSSVSSSSSSFSDSLQFTVQSLESLLSVSQQQSSSNPSSENISPSLTQNTSVNSENLSPLSSLARKHLESKAIKLSLSKSVTSASSSLLPEKPIDLANKDKVNLFSGQGTESDFPQIPDIKFSNSSSFENSSLLQMNSSPFSKETENTTFIIPQNSSGSNNLLSQLAQNHLKSNQLKSSLNQDGFNKIPTLLSTSNNNCEQQHSSPLKDLMFSSFNDPLENVSVHSRSPDEGSSREMEEDDELDLLKALKISTGNVSNSIGEKRRESKDSSFSEPVSPSSEESFSLSPSSCFTFTKPVDVKEKPSLFGFILCSHLKAHKLKTPACSRPYTPNMLSQLKIEPFNFDKPSPDDIILAQQKKSHLYYKDKIVPSN